MNTFSSVQGSGLLKSFYDPDNAMLDAIKKRRDKLTNRVWDPTKEKIEQSETIKDEFND